MALFGFLKKGKKKKDGGEQATTPPSRTKSTGLLGTSKPKAPGIIGAMGLAESVPEAAQADLEAAVEDNDGLVTELDRGYTVMIMNNIDLDELDIDVKSEDFGSLANDIKENNIQAVVLPEDLGVGVLSIIPTRDSIEALREYSILDAYTYNIGALPKELTEDSQVHLYEDTFTIERLFEANQEGHIFIEVDEDHVKLGNPMDLGREDLADEDQLREAEEQELINDTSGSAFDEPDDFIDDEALETDITPVEETDDFEDDDPFLEDALEDELEASFEDAYEQEPLADDDDFGLGTFDEPLDDLDDTFGMGDLDDEFIYTDDDDFENDGDELAAERRGLTAIESAKELLEVTNRAFSNDELGLELRGEAFNNQIADFDPVLFDENIEVDGELDQVAKRMRQDANTAIIAHHNSEVQKLRTLFTTGLSRVHDRLGDDLDYQNTQTVFGQKWENISRSHREELADMDVVKRDQLKALRDEYEEAKEREGEQAKQEAMHRYDRDHRGSVERKLETVMAEYRDKVDLDKKSREAEVLDLRQKTAKRIYDKAVTNLLITIQERFERLMQEEKALYIEHQNKLKQYYEEHYSDEVMRKQALREELKQTHKADSVRAEYEQMLQAKSRELQEAQERADRQLRDLANTKDSELRDLVSRHQDELNNLRSRHADVLHEKDEHIEALKADQEDLFKKVETVRQDIREEYESNTRALKGQLHLAESKLEAHKDKLDEFVVRQSTEDYRKALMMGASSVVALAVGLFAGWAIFSSPVQNNSDPTFINQNGEPVKVIDINDIPDEAPVTLVDEETPAETEEEQQTEENNNEDGNNEE